MKGTSWSRNLFRFVIIGATSILCASQVMALRWNTTIANDGLPHDGDPFPQHSDRFYIGGDRDFVGEGFDWSGVGISQGVFVPDGIPEPFVAYQGTWLTMISDTYFLTSIHPMSVPRTVPVRFYPTNDMGDGYETHYTDSSFWEQIDGSDLLLGRLTSTPTSAIKRYPLIKRLNDTNYSSYLDPKTFIVGYADTFSDSNYFRVGLNDVDRFGSRDGYDSFGWDHDSVSSYGDNEVRTIGGDSSAPTFAVSPMGGLGLTGINWFVNAASPVGPYISQIASTIATESGGLERVEVMTDQLADFNGDYKVDSADYIIFALNYSHTGASYNDGDLNGDGSVTTADYVIFSTQYGHNVFAPSDFNKDGAVDKIDMLQIGNNWHTSVTAGTNGDADGDGDVDGQDIEVLNANWVFGRWSPANLPVPVVGDLTNGLVPKDGVVNGIDYNIFMPEFSPQNSCSAPSWCHGADFDTDGDVDVNDYLTFVNHYDPYAHADINQDHNVDNDDLAILLDEDHWMQTIAGGKSVGDLNGDGTVNVADFQIMTYWWGRGVGSAGEQPDLGFIPEPSTAFLVCVGALILIGARRGRG